MSSWRSTRWRPTILYGSSGGEPVEVVVHVNDDVIEASVLDNGPDLPTQPSTDADTLGARGRGLWRLPGRLADRRLAGRAGRGQAVQYGGKAAG